MNLVLSCIQWFSLLFISPAGTFVIRHAVAWYCEGSFWSNSVRSAFYYSVVAVAGGLVTGAAEVILHLGTGVHPVALAALVAGNLIVLGIGSQNVVALNTLGFGLPYVILSNLGVWSGVIAATVLATQAPTAAEWLTGLLGGQLIACTFSTIMVKQLNQAATRRPSGREDAFSFSGVWSFASPLVLQRSSPGAKLTDSASFSALVLTTGLWVHLLLASLSEVWFCS